MKFYTCGSYAILDKWRPTSYFNGKIPSHLSILSRVIMRINFIALIIGIACFNVSALVLGQTITVQVKDAPLEQVLGSIKKQSNYGLWYETSLIKRANKVTLSLNKVSLKQALDKCFEKQPLTYSIVGKTIFIKEKEKPLIDKATGYIKENITGKVRDEQSQPLPGVTISIKGTSNSVMADEQGSYKINAKPGDILVFSYLGYQTKEVSISNQTDVNVSLVAVTGELEMITAVNTGYQSLSKERATGSFAKIDNELFNRRVSTNILDRLEGVTSSLAFNKNYLSSDPNASPISIRGMSTIFSNTKPLIIVDNFPFDGNIENLNPNDIESITVLKDAAATSIWGVRSGNGVIVINTKKGNRLKEMNIDLNLNSTFISKPDIYYGKSFIKATDFIDAEKYLFGNGYYNATLSNATTRPLVSPVVEILNQQRAGTLTQAQADDKIEGLKNIDFRDDQSRYLYQNAVLQQYALNLSGGSDNFSYYLSGGYDNAPSTLVGNRLDRKSIYSSISFSPLKNLEASTAVNFTQANSEANSLGNLFPASGKAAYYPYARLIDENGNAAALQRDYRYSFIESLSSTPLLDWKFRPLDELELKDNSLKTTYVKISTSLKYTFIPGLNIDVKYQLETQNDLSRNEQNQQSYFTRNLINLNSIVNGNNVTRPLPMGGILDQGRNELIGNSFRAQLNFNKVFMEQHEINFIGGIDSKELKIDQNNWRSYGYSPEVGTTVPVDYNTLFTKYSNLLSPGRIPYANKSDKLLDEYFSYFANASYSFLKKYTLSASGRIDQSNLFGVATNQKSVPLWSVGASWNIDQEKFYNLKGLPYLKLRATYGYSGNIDKSTSAYTTGLFSTSSAITGLPYVVIQNPPNPELRWEKIGMFNAGIDFRTKNNFLSGSIEYYHKKGTDIMGYAPADPTSGMTQYKGNVASIKGSGIDLELNMTTGTKIKWLGTILFSRNTDQVISYDGKAQLSLYLQTADGTTTTQSITPIVGRPIYSLYSYPWAGLDPENGNPRGYLNGQISTDYAAIGRSNNINDAIFHGSARPTIFGAIRNSFSYKNLSLSFNITYKFGYYFRKPSLNYSKLASSWEGTNDYSHRWQKKGDEINTNIPSFTYPLNTSRDSFFQYAEVNVEKGDHVRFQDLQLNYKFNNSKRKLPFKSLEIYGYANNLNIIWKKTKADIDPDYVNNQFVQPRSFALGLRSSF